MGRRNARLIPTTEKSGLATPLWSDSEFKTLLGEQMDLIVTEKFRQELTQKYEIHPDKTWSVDECKKVLGASIRKNNVKGIICCHREFSVTLATQQSQRNSELEKQNNELRARVSTLTKKLNLRAVQAAHLALQASSGMVLGQTVNVKCPHAVSTLMNQAKVTSVTSSRWGNWLANLTTPNIVIQRAPVTNPSSCMMSAMTEFVLEDEGEMTHDCVTLTYAATSEIAETPIENAELELFVDGSAQVIEGNRRAGYAVTSTTEVVASGRLPDHFSAQAAELVALTRACTLASGSVANIYTDSRYAFGVIHDFGVIWQTRKFLTSAGSPIKHAGLVKDLMFAMKLPKKLAVIKVKAHLTTNTTEAKGNTLADVAAKQACFYATVQVCSGSTAQKTILPPESIVDLYKDVPLYEAWTWLDKGATVDSSGCWTKGGKYVAPESLLPYLAQQIHSLGHSGPATMNHRFSNQWWNPKFRNTATETVKRCVTCQKNNDVPAATTPAAHTPAPPGPFRHLQVDYISLPPCKGKTDVLVVIDKFSRWVEAYPTGRATAAHTAKCLVTDFIPRWGLPDYIDSDQGTHFTGQVVKEVSRMLKIKWNLHCPYRPQARTFSRSRNPMGGTPYLQM